MLFQKDSILLFNQYMRSAKSLCVNYADFEQINVQEIDGCANNLQ